MTTDLDENVIDLDGPKPALHQTVEEMNDWRFAGITFEDGDPTPDLLGDAVSTLTRTGAATIADLPEGPDRDRLMAKLTAMDQYNRDREFGMVRDLVVSLSLDLRHLRDELAEEGILPYPEDD